MSAHVHIGNVLDVLPTLEAGSVNCVVTSPPYWGLRDYGTATWEGGDADCDHKVGRFTSPVSDKQRSNNGSGDVQAAGVCPKCGARRKDSQLGLEPTPDQYVANMVAVFREVWRVLRDDGTLWLNLGDSYAGGGRGSSGDGPTSPKQRTNLGAYFDGNTDFDHGLKPKDLVGIPWRVAFALQADGWYLRSDIIWAKKNPMPESVTDRPTKSHEYIFLLSKRPRYFYDADAVAEASVGRELFGNWTGGKASSNGDRNDGGRQDMTPTQCRNRRTVWHIATQPYADAHFATYPEKLVEPCVLAGCPVGGTVLDPFTGSGTTGAVACRLGRNFVGVELNPEYAAMAERRIAPHRDQMQLVTP